MPPPHPLPAEDTWPGVADLRGYEAMAALPLPPLQVAVVEGANVLEALLSGSTISDEGRQPADGRDPGLGPGV